MKSYLGLIEMLFVFGSGVAFVLWEIYSVRRKPPKQVRDIKPDSANPGPPDPLA